MPRKATDAEAMQEYRQIPAYPDYEVTVIGKVRNKTFPILRSMDGFRKPQSKFKKQ